MKVTNLDVSVAIVEDLVKRGLITPDVSASFPSGMFQIQNAIEDVLDNLLPFNREHR
jgi:hypothetical protein